MENGKWIMENGEWKSPPLPAHMKGGADNEKKNKKDFNGGIR